MDATTDLDATLRGHGHRVTRPRRAVWKALSRAGRHLTVEELTAALAEQGEDIDLASVYRTLGLFEDLGLARVTHLGGEAGRWELAHPDERFHLVCGGCGEVDHHGGGLVDQITAHLRDDHGFEVDGVELVVSGRCARCRERAEVAG